MRVYVWTHAWLSPLQKGIQGAHAVAELVHKQGKLTKVWVEDHKTLIYLNGGNTAQMRNIEYDVGISGYESASFCEDDASLESALTAVAVLLTPAQLDSMKRREMHKEHWPPGTVQWWITNTRLAS